MPKTVIAWHSLKTRVTLAMLVIFAAGLWSLLLISDQMLHENMERQTGEQEFSTVSAVAASLNSDFILRFESLTNAASRIATLMPNEKRVHAFLDDSAVLQSMFNGGIIVINRNAEAIADYPKMDRVGLNYSDRDSVISALKEGKSSVGRPAIGKVWHAPTFLMTVPINDIKGNVIGALSGVVNLDKISFLNRIAENRYGKTGGYVLAASRHNMTVTGTDKSFLTRPFPAPGINPLLDRYAQGFEGSGRTLDASGVDMLSASAQIPVAGWFLVARIPAAEAFQPIRDMQKSMYSITILLTLSACALTWWVLRRQLSPLVDTAKTLADLAEKDEHPQPLPILRKDEIGQLIGGFNHLLKALGSREVALRLSEEQYRTTFQTSLDAININRLKDGLYIDVNQAFLDIMGYERNEVIGHTSLDLNIWADPLERQHLVEMLQRDSKCHNLEAQFKRKNGEVIWGLMSGSIMTLDNEPCIISTTRDITERKHEIQALHESEARFRNLFEKNSSIMLLIEPDSGEIVAANQSAINYYGFPPGQLVGMSISQINTLSPEESAIERHKALREEKKPFPFQESPAFWRNPGRRSTSDPCRKSRPRPTSFNRTRCH